MIWLARPVALALVCALTSGAVGCGKDAPPPPVDDTRMGQVAPANRPLAPAAEPEKAGMGTGTKVVMLAGAAALYYLYKQHQSAAAPSGENSQYYLSKNGRVYYRDAEHRAHWVTPPSEGVRVPESEARQYQGFQGYEGSSSGRDLAGLSDQ